MAICKGCEYDLDVWDSEKRETIDRRIAGPGKSGPECPSCGEPAAPRDPLGPKLRATQPGYENED